MSTQFIIIYSFLSIDILKYIPVELLTCKNIYAKKKKY